MADLKVGQKAADFTLPTRDHGELSLKKLKDKKVILYFYPKDSTSGCTKEACSFRDNLKSIETKGAVVVGITSNQANLLTNIA